MEVIKPFSSEQERALINLRQRYDVWIDAERTLSALPYDLRRKKVGEYEYLYKINDRGGNGSSLGAQAKRNPLKRRKDRIQGAALLSAVAQAMPHYPLDEEFVATLPDELITEWEDWTKGSK